MVSIRSVIEALLYIGFTGLEIGGILYFSNQTPEVHAFSLTIALVSVTIIVPTLIYILCQSGSQKFRSLGLLGSIGYFMIGGAITLIEYPVLGIIVALVGLCITMYAIYDRDRNP